MGRAFTLSQRVLHLWGGRVLSLWANIAHISTFVAPMFQTRSCVQYSLPVVYLTLWFGYESHWPRPPALHKSRMYRLSTFFILNNQSSEEAGMWSEGWDRLLLNNRWGYLFWEQLREASIIFFCSLLFILSRYGLLLLNYKWGYLFSECWKLNSFCYRHHTSRMVCA